MSESEDVQVTPRLCHLVKWPDFEGYGFNLHAEKSRPGQFVGAVDPGSPAEAAGLRPGDRIVEVNGVNVSHENHRQVVERIKAVEDETRLLVLDTDADRLCREKKIVVKSTMPNVLVIKTPTTRDPPEYLNVEPPQQNGKTNGEEAPPVAANGKHEEKAPPVAANGKHEEEKVPEEKPSPPPAPKLDTPPPTLTKTKEELPLQTSRSSTPSIPDSPRSTKSSTSSSGGGVASNGGPALSVSTPMGGLNLNMSASEMRQMLANRRKKDPKKENMDIRQKYDIIQQM